MRHTGTEDTAMYTTLQLTTIMRARCNVLGLHRSHPPCGQLPRRSGQSGPDRHFLQTTPGTATPAAHRARSSFLSMFSIH